MKSSTFLGAIPLVAIAALGGCDALIGIETLEAGDPGGAVSCQTPADCPQAGNGCFLRECVGGVCGLREAPADTPVASQVEGDCQIVKCDAAGNAVPQADQTDAFNDGNECTEDLCLDGGATSANVPAGTACSGGVCDGAGSCVACVDASDCAGANDRCIEQQCVPATCQNGVVDTNETGVDCGGVCPRCPAGQPCNGPDDCKSGVCEGDVCQAASCEDDIQNGGESDVDCGGDTDCPRCDTGSQCSDPADCVDLVCTCDGLDCDPVCAAPTCFDGEKNGEELAVDCGPGCEGACDDGEPCTNDDQCSSQVCLEEGCAEPGKCCQVPNCDDGKHNGIETGVDCGEAACEVACNG